MIADRIYHRLVPARCQIAERCAAAVGITLRSNRFRRWGPSACPTGYGLIIAGSDDDVHVAGAGMSAHGRGGLMGRLLKDTE